jgi:uncharacterized protein with GYD domain
MAAINFDEGLPGIVLAKYAQATQKQVKQIKLYTGIASTLRKATVLADFTEVGGVMGYALKTVGNADFATILDVVNHWCIASATYTWIFTAGAGLTILGWYSTDLVAGGGGGGSPTVAVTGEQFATAVVIPPAGGSLQVNINDKYRDC